MHWEYDTRLGRRWNMDPVPSAFESFYSCFSNRPIYFTDPDGDEVDVSKVSKPNQEKLVNDLAKKTGLRLKVENGKIVYETYKEDKDGHKKGDPIVDAGGSKTAQKLLMKSINSKHVATVNESKGIDKTSPDRMDIFINFANIDKKLNDNTGYFVGKGITDKTTDGFAMTFFHEVQHTKAGGSRNDGLATIFRPLVGPVERKVNHIRVELGMQKNYSYITFRRDLYSTDKDGKEINWGNKEITPFSRKTLLKLIFHKKMTSNDAYIAE